MTNMKVINLFLVFSGLVKSSQPSPEPQGLFQPTNRQIQATIHAVFGTLRISDNFTKSKNIAHYLSLNNFVKETVKKNDKIYQNIYRKFKNASSNKTGAFILNIDKVIGEMIRRQKVKIIKDLLNNKKSNSRDTSHNRLVIEFIKFAKGFNLKLNTPSPYDLLGLRPGKKWPERKGQDAETRRIFNGTATRVTSYPFMASLHVRGRFVCAGSLLRADLVITAASGLIPLISPQSDPRSVKVRVGSDYTNKFGELVPVAGFHFHPKFNRTTLRCNLAIIQLKKLLKLEYGKLTVIQYDTTMDYLPADLKSILILGWGEKRPSPGIGYKYDASNQKLSLTRLDLQDLKECKQKYSRTYVSNKHFCAGGSENNGGGACQFDVGGPAVAGRTLVGVASFGAPRCGERDAPTVFTKLGFYADWIESFFKVDLPHSQHNPKKAPSVNITDSDEVPANEKQFYYKPVRTGFKPAREIEREREDMLYGLENEDDTFQKTSKPDPHTHPLLDKAVFLDPDLIPTMPKFSEELTEATLPQDIKTMEPPPLGADKEMENLDWDMAEEYLFEALGSKKPTSKAPTSTNTIKKSSYLPAGLATIAQYTKLPPFSLTTTTESAYGEYSFDMMPRSITSTTSSTITVSTATIASNTRTAVNASAASTSPAAARFTRMGPFYNARSQKQYQNSQHKFLNAQKDQEHNKNKMNDTIRRLGSIPQYDIIDKKNLQEVLDWQALRRRLQVSP